MSRFLLGLLLLLAGPALAQRVSQVDFGDVQDRTTDKDAPFYFPKLLSRLQQADTTLGRQEYYYLYYGQVYAPGYQPYDAGDLSDEFRTAYEAAQYEQALTVGLPELAQHPFNLKLRQKVFISLSRLGRQAEARRYSQAFFGLIYTVLGSGDGHAASTAFVPVAVADEYAVLSYYDLTWSKQLLQGTTDMFTLTGTHEPPRDERHTFTGKLLYFDVSWPLRHLRNQFKK